MFIEFILLLSFIQVIGCINIQSSIKSRLHLPIPPTGIKSFSINNRGTQRCTGSNARHENSHRNTCKVILRIAPSIFSLFLLSTRKSHASAYVASSNSISQSNPLQGLLVWGVCFICSAVLHAAESAITKISPFKVQQLAEAEGKSSPFATLSENVTRLLSTILLSTTALSIYSTALFVSSLSALLPDASLGFITAALTVVTLFFGELFPKAFAVAKPEMVTRVMVPVIVRLMTPLRPVTEVVNLLSGFVLRLFGPVGSEENVSEDMLRIVVAEAQRSEGIETGERKMIEAVLDMQNTEVSKIMQPRIDIVAVDEDTPAAEIMHVAVVSKYSRIPVYRKDVDHIVGVVYTKDLLTLDPSLQGVGASVAKVAVNQKPSPWTNVTAADLMQPTYFIPETMSTWTALQALQRRRGHLAVVVDEYGGTSGIVTLEDILEEVVGEIYDEDDMDEQTEDLQTISALEDGSYAIQGVASLEDVCERLELRLDDDQAQDSMTVGGLLCALAGEIPCTGDTLDLQGFRFTVTEADDRRVIAVTVRRVQSSDSSGAEEGAREPAPVSKVDPISSTAIDSK